VHLGGGFPAIAWARATNCHLMHRWIATDAALAALSQPPFTRPTSRRLSPSPPGGQPLETSHARDRNQAASTTPTKRSGSRRPIKQSGLTQ
jgi:hypothetical protein